MIVAGAVLMLIVAPAVLVGSIMGGLNLGEITGSATTVASGSSVQVDESGTYVVTSTAGDTISCTLTGSDGTVLQLQSPDDGSIAMGSGIEPGTYTLDCGAATSLVGMTGVSADQMTEAGVRGLLWASLVGLAGLALTIVGIVLLVRVNRQRRDLQRQAWGGGGYGTAPGGSGYGGRPLY
jgi:hypothetical protein